MRMLRRCKRERLCRGRHGDGVLRNPAMQRRRRSLPSQRQLSILCRCFAALLPALLLIVEVHIVQQASPARIPIEDPQHLLSLAPPQLLRVPTLRHALILHGVLELDVTQLPIGNVLDKDVLHLEVALPFALLSPDGRRCFKVYGRGHESHAAEVARAIDREEEVDMPRGNVACRGIARTTVTFGFCRLLTLLEDSVQPLIPLVSRSPDTVADGSMYVILGEGLDDEEARRGAW